jgi:hypothetical protein
VEPRVNQKEVKVGEQSYSIKKMDPRLACWLFSVLAGKAPSGSSLLAALGNCSKSEFDEIQGHALRFVFHCDLQDGVLLEIPILGSNGMWAIKELNDDPSKVYKLTTESIMFNINPFLEGNKSTDQPLNR